MNLSIIIFSAFLAATTPKAGNFAATATAPESAAIGDLFARVTRLEEDNRKLEGKAEELEYKLNQLEKENIELKKQVEKNKISSVKATEITKPESSTTLTENKIIITKTENSASTPAVTPPTEKKEDSSATPNREFEAAFALMSEQNLPEAKTAFEKFTKKYPNSSLSGEAYYWLGEMNFDDKDYNNAAINYLKGYRDYPKGNKAAENILKLALTLNQMGKTSEACENLARFKTEFKSAHANLRAKAANKSKELACK